MGYIKYTINLQTLNLLAIFPLTEILPALVKIEFTSILHAPIEVETKNVNPRSNKILWLKIKGFMVATDSKMRD